MAINRLFRILIVSLASVALSGLLDASDRGLEQRRPNVLLIHMDDFGFAQFGPNNEGLTVKDLDPLYLQYVRDKNLYDEEEAFALAAKAVPCLSSLAKDGIRFARAYAITPQTMLQNIRFI